MGPREAESEPSEGSHVSETLFWQGRWLDSAQRIKELQQSPSHWTLGQNPRGFQAILYQGSCQEARNGLCGPEGPV